MFYSLKYGSRGVSVRELIQSVMVMVVQGMSQKLYL